MNLTEQIKAQATQAATIETTPPPSAPKAPVLVAPAERKAPTLEERIEARRLLRAGLEPLPAGRVGCTMWWSARNVVVRAPLLRAALLAAERATACPKCKAAAGETCNDMNAGPAGAAPCPTHEERAPRFHEAVRPKPVEPATAMRRSLGRAQSALDGARWLALKESASKLRVALGVLTTAESAATGDALSTCAWEVEVDKDTGDVRHPPEEMLTDDERTALRALLHRYEVERENLTATDVTDALTKIILDVKGMCGVRVKAGGSVYFIPAPDDEHIDRLADAFDLADVALMRTPVTAGAAAQFREDATESLEEEASKMLIEARAAAARLDAAHRGEKGKGKPQFKATMDRLDACDALRKRATAYQKMLGALSATVDAALTESKAATERVLSDLTGGIL